MRLRDCEERKFIFHNLLLHQFSIDGALSWLSGGSGFPRWWPVVSPKGSDSCCFFTSGRKRNPPWKLTLKSSQRANVRGFSVISPFSRALHPSSIVVRASGVEWAGHQNICGARTWNPQKCRVPFWKEPDWSKLITTLTQEIQQLSSQLFAPPWRLCEHEFSLFLFTLLILRWKENSQVGRYLYRPERDIDIPIDAVRLEHGLDCSRAEGQHGFLVLQGKHTNLWPLTSHRHGSNVVKTLRFAIRLGFFIKVWETDLEHTFIIHVFQGKCETLCQHSVKPTLQDGRDAEPVQGELQKDH